MAISTDDIIRCSCGCGWMKKIELVLIKESKSGAIVETSKKRVYSCYKCNETIEEISI